MIFCFIKALTFCRTKQKVDVLNIEVVGYSGNNSPCVLQPNSKSDFKQGLLYSMNGLHESGLIKDLKQIGVLSLSEDLLFSS